MAWAWVVCINVFLYAHIGMCKKFTVGMRLQKFCRVLLDKSSTPNDGNIIVLSLYLMEQANIKLQL